MVFFSFRSLSLLSQTLSRKKGKNSKQRFLFFFLFPFHHLLNMSSAFSKLLKSMGKDGAAAAPAAAEVKRAQKRERGLNDEIGEILNASLFRPFFQPQKSSNSPRPSRQQTLRTPAAPKKAVVLALPPRRRSSPPETGHRRRQHRRRRRLRGFCARRTLSRVSFLGLFAAQSLCLIC